MTVDPFIEAEEAAERRDDSKPYRGRQVTLSLAIEVVDAHDPCELSSELHWRPGNTVAGHSVERHAVYRREQRPVEKAR